MAVICTDYRLHVVENDVRLVPCRCHQTLKIYSSEAMRVMKRRNARRNECLIKTSCPRAVEGNAKVFHANLQLPSARLNIFYSHE